MSEFYRKQETETLHVGAYWLLVKKHQTAGDQRDAFDHLIKSGTFKAGGQPEFDYKQLGIAEAVCYLLDWNVTDADDQPIVIRDKSYDFVAAALNNMTPEGCRRIIEEIQRHDAAMIAEREGQKKVPVGENAPSPTSTSVG